MRWFQPLTQLSINRSIYFYLWRTSLISSQKLLPVQDCCAIMLFAFHGGINNDSTSRADNYGVSVGWNGDAPAAYLGG
ncbi:MAG: hypothetical protein IIX79_01925 [Alistipes sp.]|nr:hypothetical protein [Alistipes sp.]MBQ1981065.1 hypothetical protein [Alistipes sp.]MBQ5913773.1 hypothetical protein [Alistipes sp.]